MHHHKRYLLLLIGLLVVAAFMFTSDALYGQVDDLVIATEVIIDRYPVGGLALFVLLSMASAMLAFMSSALVVPIAVHAWGPFGTLVLLWLGWLLGGAASYSIGRLLGRRIATFLVGEDRLARFETRLSSHTTFVRVLLFQAALPSEIPGYVLGLVRYRWWRYLAALALAELPYALGTVYLGESFLRRQPLLFLAVGAAGIALSALTYTMYRRRAGLDHAATSEGHEQPPP